MVAGLRPGIGKEEVQAPDRVRGEEPFDGVAGFETEDLQVVMLPLI